MRKTGILLTISLLLLTLQSCVTFSNIPLVREFYRELELKDGSVITFDNLHGDLVVFGWQKEKAEIRATKTGTDSQLRQTDIEVKKKGNELVIKTFFPRADIKNVFVDYELRLPSQVVFKEIKIEKGDVSFYQLYGGLNLSLGEGDIEIEDLGGKCRLVVDEGNVVARIYEIKGSDDFLFKTNKGNLRLYLPPEISARIEAETRLGKIESELVGEEEKLPAKKWSRSYGKGEALIRLQCWEGNIELKSLKI
ncbi:MAG: hypothetical protein ACE5LC_08570 [Candidatus Aminicenantales bacterium]